MNLLPVPEKASGFAAQSEAESPNRDVLDRERDLLGRIEFNKARGVLTTTLHTQLDAALVEAISVMKEELAETEVKEGKVSAAVLEDALAKMNAALFSNNTIIKKYFFLVCFTLSDRVKAIYEPHCPIYKFRPWLSKLPGISKNNSQKQKGSRLQQSAQVLFLAQIW